MTAGIELAMSRAEFDERLGDAIAKIETWKLDAVIEHIKAIAKKKATKRKKRNKSQSGGKKEKPYPYEQYMKSAMWSGIRMVVLSRDHYTCMSCGDPAQEVHHRSYEIDVLEGRDNSKLASLCRRCHTRIHYDDSNKKLSRSKTEKKLRQMIRAREERLKLIQIGRKAREGVNEQQNHT